MRLMKNYKKIMLIITENCNLRCTYCYEQEKRKHTMDFSTAKKIIDQSYRSMEPYESMIIELHGGEPFINFELIQQIDTYVMENYSKWPVLFRMITNGTLVKGEIQTWLRNRKDRYEVMLSLDGKQEIHDANRKTVGGKGSFASIDLDFFRSTWEKCPISMTVNERTLPYLAEGTIWMEELGLDCLNAFEWAADWNIEKNIFILKGQLEILSKYYIAHPEKKPCLLLRYNLASFYRTFGEEFRYCEAIGDPMECYDAQGNFAPCHGFTEFTMGSEEKAKDFCKMTIHNFVFTEDNICKDCKLLGMCRICFAANYMQYGDMQKQDKAICLFNQLCILYGLRIQEEKIKVKPVKTEEEIETLKTAETVRSYLMAKKELNLYV